MELYSSENSDEEEQNRNQIDLSYRSLDTQTLHENIEYICAGNEKEKKAENIRTLYIYQNQLVEIPNNVLKFCNLRKLDMSNNRLLQLPECVSTLPLEVLIAKNNNIDEYSLPKSLERLSHTLENLNLSGNRLTSFPQQIFDLFKLKYLYLGQNGLDEIPAQIHKLNRLEILSLGGNTIREVPSSVCQLHELKALILSSNELEKLPPCIANLKKLRTLQLHKNKLKTLPTEIVRLKYLTELSLRDNPLVAKFVNDMVYNPPRLRELSARVIKQYEIPYDNEVLPEILIEYLSSAHHCLNPNCKGVYFDQKVEHIKFVDFCGKYRVPLLQYLCSSKCIDSSAKDSRRYNTNEEASSSRSDMIRKVLLG